MICESCKLNRGLNQISCKKVKCYAKGVVVDCPFWKLGKATRKRFKALNSPDGYVTPLGRKYTPRIES